MVIFAWCQMNGKGALFLAIILIYSHTVILAGPGKPKACHFGISRLT